MLRLFDRFSSRYQIEIFCFCLMSNHYHLFLRTLKPNLSLAMQWLNGTYTIRFHRRQGRRGHLLEGRYKAVMVADPAHWLHLSAYLHLNPVRSGLVADPAQYEWSSFRDYTRARGSFSWLQTAVVLSSYGKTDIERRRNYRRQVLALSGRPASFWEELRNAVFLGTGEQWERLKAKHPPSGRRKQVTEYGIKPGRVIDIKEETARAAAEFGVSAVEIHAGRRSGSVRPALYFHLVEHCGLSGSRVADHFGVSEMAVSLGITRLRKKLAEDKVLRKRIQRLMFIV